MNITNKLEKIGFIPVVKINRKDQAVPLAKSLLKANLPCLEITFRTEIAKDAIKNIKKEYPNMIVGAGTIINKEQVDKAVKSGADFIVTPGINSEIVQYCQNKKIPIFPGCATPSEIELAINLGLKIVKFFPAESIGGIDYIKSLSGPYNEIKFFPTGGINKDNIYNYIKNKNIFACGSSSVVSEYYLDNEKFDEIEKLTDEVLHSMLGFELAHIGINCENENYAKSISSLIEYMFGFARLEKKDSIFVDSYFEMLKSPFLGEKGHIAIRTNSVERAIDYLERKNISFNHETVSYNEDKLINTIYFKEELFGFALHLIRK